MSSARRNIRRRSKRLNTESSEIPKDLINNLNNDCLVEIFKKLPIHERIVNIEQVCKRWRDSMELVWNDTKTLEFADYNQHTGELRWRTQNNISEILKKSGDHLTELSFLTMNCDTKILTTINKYCKNLKKLVIRNLDYDNWKELLPNLPKLEYLEMSAADGNCPEHFFKDLPHETLTHLHLRHCPVVSIFFHADLLRKLKNLKSLSISNATLGCSMMEAISQQSDLTSLKLEACFINGDITRLTRLTKLERLDLRFLSSIDDNFLIKASNRCKNLKYLRISHCPSVNGLGIISLQKLRLEELVITANKNISDQSLKTLRNLKKLRCQFCQFVKEDGIIELIRNSSTLEDLTVDFLEVSKNFTKAVQVTMKRKIDGIPLRLNVVNLTDKKERLRKYSYSSSRLNVKLESKLVVLEKGSYYTPF